MTSVIPVHFPNLYPQFECNNYYAGDGGDRIGLIQEEKTLLGLRGIKSMWVHPDTYHSLLYVREEIRKHGFDIIVRDGLRTKRLYDAIAKHRRKLGLRVEGLINLKNMPHATGLAVDVSLVTYNEARTLTWIRFQSDGDQAEKFGFYANCRDKQRRQFHRLQKMLLSAFEKFGYELGVLRECWHFQRKGINANTPRY